MVLDVVKKLQEIGLLYEHIFIMIFFWSQTGALEAFEDDFDSGFDPFPSTSASVPKTSFFHNFQMNWVIGYVK